MLPSFASRQVTIERAPYIDSRGTQVRDWSQASSRTVNGCLVQPVDGSTAWTDPTQAVTVRARLWCPPGTDIQPDDRVIADGIIYAIEGAPMAWQSPTGAIDHIEAALVDWRL